MYNLLKQNAAGMLQKIIEYANIANGFDSADMYYIILYVRSKIRNFR